MTFQAITAYMIVAMYTFLAGRRIWFYSSYREQMKNPDFKSGLNQIAEQRARVALQDGGSRIWYQGGWWGFWTLVYITTTNLVEQGTGGVLTGWHLGMLSTVVWFDYLWYRRIRWYFKKGKLHEPKH